MLQKYSLIIGKVHTKVKELGNRLEEGERAKRHKIKKMRKQMEKELESLKQRNT